MCDKIVDFCSGCFKIKFIMLYNLITIQTFLHVLYVNIKFIDHIDKKKNFS